MIPLSVPNLMGNELKYVNKCIETGWISSAGEFVSEFEKKIKEYTGAKHAIACINGTSSLHISLMLSGVNKNDIVIAPNLTFVATLNSISYTNATPYLIDVNENTWQIDNELLLNWLENNTYTKFSNNKKITFEKKTGLKISAIVPVYVLGGFPEIDELIRIGRKYGISIIEDSTEALGSFKNKKHAGTFGDFGTISFNGNKIISTGGGGMILTNDDNHAKKAKHITTTSKSDPMEYYHDEIGYNYRMVNLLAAIGVAQMENFQNILNSKKKIFNLYKTELAEIGDIIFQKNIENTSPNNWLFTFRTKKMRPLLNYLIENNIQCRPFWIPMNHLPMYKNCFYITKNNVSNIIYNECISIPSSSNLQLDDQKKVINLIKDFFKNETT